MDILNWWIIAKNSSFEKLKQFLVETCWSSESRFTVGFLMKDYSFLLHMRSFVVRFHFCWKLSLNLSLWSLEVLDVFVQPWILHAQTKSPAMWKLQWWFPSNQWLAKHFFYYFICDLLHSALFFFFSHSM